LQWSYDNFANNRRQSLKDVYELCLAFVNNKIDKIELKKRLEDYFKFTETTIVLQNIADNPTANYLYWFTVFYSENDLFLELDKIIELQSNLSRFLESYTFNSGLNLLSGLIRLLVNDYSNPDGKIRLENSLNQLNNYDNVIQLNIFENILTIGLHLDLENKNNLSESLISIPFPNALKEYDRIFKIFKYLEDTYSIKYLLEKIIIPKLIKVKEKFYARLK
jgi:ATP-dependent DNA helicase RecQ